MQRRKAVVLVSGTIKVCAPLPISWVMWSWWKGSVVPVGDGGHGYSVWGYWLRRTQQGAGCFCSDTEVNDLAVHARKDTLPPLVIVCIADSATGTDLIKLVEAQSTIRQVAHCLTTEKRLLTSESPPTHLCTAHLSEFCHQLCFQLHQAQFLGVVWYSISPCLSHLWMPLSAKLN